MRDVRVGLSFKPTPIKAIFVQCSPGYVVYLVITVTKLIGDETVRLDYTIESTVGIAASGP